MKVKAGGRRQEEVEYLRNVFYQQINARANVVCYSVAIFVQSICLLYTHFVSIHEMANFKDVLRGARTYRGFHPSPVQDWQ
jgi:hypothetical protein